MGFAKVIGFKGYNAFTPSEIQGLKEIQIHGSFYTQLQATMNKV